MAHNQDWLEWLLSLNANAVEYVIVGGVALAHHAAALHGGPGCSHSRHAGKREFLSTQVIDKIICCMPHQIRRKQSACRSATNNR